MTKKARVTIKDIARLAQVTPQAVSRALRDAPDISAETKARIQKIASDLNYCKNTTASSLRSGSARLIAIVYDELKNMYYSVMVDYLQAFLQARGYSTLTFAYKYSYLDKDTFLTAVSHNVSGIISFLEPDSEVGALLDEYRIPFLLFGRCTDHKGADCIYTDDVTGGRLVAEHFVAKGCRNPLFVTLPHELACERDRLRGFAEGFKAYGVRKVAECHKGTALQGELIRAFASEQAPDCIFCFNDMIAFEVISALQQNGLHNVPVVGYDDIQSHISLPTCRLTTVGCDGHAMAQQGIDMILARIDGRVESGARRLHPVYLTQGTTG